MRLSTIPGDPGYDAWEDLLRQNTYANVTLDGEVVRSCVLADTDIGEVAYFLEDEDGYPVVRDDEFVVQHAMGEVTITLDHPAQGSA